MAQLSGCPAEGGYDEDATGTPPRWIGLPLTLLGRSGPPGPYMQTLAIIWSPLVPDTAYEENTLRVVARFGADLDPDTVVLTGYLFKLLQL